ncbi:HPr family phosphocarrier protein [Anaerobium acetethylicum]|uniref:PTS HPr component phosphorylation site n=1 Tax=Anaerobium acetethylicum TaxID=1619234 RepID=A0A1D3TW59_9FIRM|nr:HPr family phosphocarrier protein [Anaerobium acetethylicum]SCP98424.1 PTS HPr component phosphorylation site [Anaerobium acetethylicum]
MAKVNVIFDTLEKVKNFVRIMSTLNGEFDLVNGNFMVDAKSILGILAIDFKRTLELRIIKSEDDVDFILAQISDFIA